MSNSKTKDSNRKFYVYAKRENYLIKLARIDKSKSNITGSLFPLLVSKNDSIKDIHFSYPKDGDYHVTAQLMDNKKIRIFHNKAFLIQENGRTEISKEEAHNFLQSRLVPNYKLPPLINYSAEDGVSFPVTLMGCNFEINFFKKFHTSKQPKGADIIIDCDAISENRAPNFVLYFLGKNTNLYPESPMQFEFVYKKELYNDYPKIFVGLFYGRLN